MILYHMLWFCVLLILALGGGSVQNDGYERMKEFALLEESNQLESAKKNPQNYSAMLQIDLQQFKNTHEFKAYLQQHDLSVDRAEALFIGWLLAFIADITVAFANLYHRRKRSDKTNKCCCLH